MEWISVEDRLPDPVPGKEGRDHSRDVLVVVDYANPEDGSRPYISTGYLHETTQHYEYPAPMLGISFDYDWTVWNWSYWYQPKVTHWMPLPDMPVERDA